MNRKDEDDELIRWLEGSLSEEELEQMIGKTNVLKYKQILGELDHWEPGHGSTVFDPELIIHKRKEAGIRKRYFPRLAVAASITLLVVASISVWFYFSSERTTYSTVAGETKEITLPDGSSKVYLASGSKISWKEEDWSDTHRNVILNGKAFFTVEKGSAFTITMPNGKVEVLGTQFEVSEFDQSLHVICYEGTVKAIAGNSQSVVLTEGEESLYYTGRWEDKKATDDDMPAWLQNETKFSEAPFEQVINGLEKVYGITINSDAIDINRRFDGAFPNDDLDAALKLVFIPYGISYSLEGENLFLSNQQSD